jgi:pyrophosphate--fructose-6-phosphate 1-phosphotransferase
MQRVMYLTMLVCHNRMLTQNANTWLMEDLYRNPGPIQFDGPGSDLITLTLLVEEHDYIGKIQELCEYLDKVSDGISQLFLKLHISMPL